MKKNNYRPNNTGSLFSENTEALCSFPLNDINRSFPCPTFKRFIDIIGALFGLIISLPFFLVIGLAIKIEDGSPIFFKQIRIGKGGKPFVLWKFRSMVVNAEELKKDLLRKNEVKGKIFKMIDDPRVTGVGKFIRRTSLDELPQFWNVLRGEMSLVGPRPALEAEVKSYDQYECQRVLPVSPGLTGLAQVAERLLGKKQDFNEQLQLDMEYIQRQSPLLDMSIILKTAWVVMLSRGQ